MEEDTRLEWKLPAPSLRRDQYMGVTTRIIRKAESMPVTPVTVPQ